MKMTLAQAVERYLETRRAFGFALVQEAVELGSFVRYAQALGHQGPLSASLALQWAQQPQQCARAYWARRLDIVRGFAQFWLAYEPRTQVPPRGCLGPSSRRRAVHIYSRQEVGALLRSAADLDRVHPWRARTFCAVVGLLDCTGLRIGEALALTDQDIDWSAGILTVRHGKGGRQRLLPVHTSTLQALQAYRALRDKAMAPRVAPRLFVGVRGQSLGYCAIGPVFRKLCRNLGWIQPPVPRLHDLRHTFAVRTLLGWYRSGESIGPKLCTLSTYLGHQHLAHTYWYLTSVPELMQLCQERFATAQAWASAGGDHA